MQHDGIADFDFAADDLSEGDTAEVIVVVEVRDEELEIRRRPWRGAAGCVSMIASKSGSIVPLRARVRSWRSRPWRWQ